MDFFAFRLLTTVNWKLQRAKKVFWFFTVTFSTYRDMCADTPSPCGYRRKRLDESSHTTEQQLILIQRNLEFH